MSADGRAIWRLTIGDISPENLGMADPYDNILKKLKQDERSNTELAGACGVPAETLRDIKSGHIKSPRLSTLRAIASLYERADAA